MSFVTKNILNNVQHGFREGKSTETATHDFLENSKKAIEKKINVIRIFFYLSKAFDVLGHKILLFKLDAYGVRGLVNQWFKSYLCNRKQYTEINYMENTSQSSEKFTSTLKEMKGEVPQGLVFGPGLFLLYTHDLPINVQKGTTTLFADDTNIQIEALLTYSMGQSPS